MTTAMMRSAVVFFFFSLTLASACALDYFESRRMSTPTSGALDGGSVPVIAYKKGKDKEGGKGRDADDESPKEEDDPANAERGEEGDLEATEGGDENPPADGDGRSEEEAGSEESDAEEPSARDPACEALANRRVLETKRYADIPMEYEVAADRLNARSAYPIVNGALEYVLTKSLLSRCFRDRRRSLQSPSSDMVMGVSTIPQGVDDVRPCQTLEASDSCFGLSSVVRIYSTGLRYERARELVLAALTGSEAGLLQMLPDVRTIAIPMAEEEEVTVAGARSSVNRQRSDVALSFFMAFLAVAIASAGFLIYKRQKRRGGSSVPDEILSFDGGSPHPEIDDEGFASAKEPNANSGNSSGVRDFGKGGDITREGESDAQPDEGVEMDLNASVAAASSVGFGVGVDYDDWSQAHREVDLEEFRSQIEKEDSETSSVYTASSIRSKFWFGRKSQS